MKKALLVGLIVLMVVSFLGISTLNSSIMVLDVTTLHNINVVVDEKNMRVDAVLMQNILGGVKNDKKQMVTQLFIRHIIPCIYYNLPQSFVILICTKKQYI